MSVFDKRSGSERPVKAFLQTADGTLRAEIASHLARCGVEVLAGDEAESAEWKSAADRPSLYVLHWLATDAVGLELCRRIRSENDGHLPFIWIVADRTGAEAVQAVLAAGADDCLSLPIDWQRLEVRLAAAKRRIAEMRRHDEINDALRRRNERLELAVRGANEGLWDALILPGIPWDSPETPVWYSSRVKELLGVSDDEFPDYLRSWAAHLHPDDQERIMQALSDHIERRAPYDVEYRLRAKSGEYRWFSARGLGIWNDAGEMIRMAGSLRDITETRRTADALKASEEKWRGLVEHAPDFILVVDLDGTIRFINRVAANFEISQVMGATAFNFVPEADRERLREAIDYVARTCQATQMETAVTAPDGKIAWYASRIGPIVRDGRVDSVILITTDVTERKLIEEERQKFFALVENSGDFIGMLTAEGALLYLNPAGRKMVGLQDATEARSLPLSDLFTAECRTRFTEIALPALLATGRWAGEIQLLHRLTGRVIDVHQKIFLVRHPQTGESLCLATITRDISDRKRSEAALRREQEFLRRLLDLQERDRQLVAYEIHDGMIQEMTGALMHLEAFKHADNQKLREQEFERGSRLLREAVNEARRLISGLRPPVLDEMGVVAAIEYLINEAREDVPDIEFVHRATFDRLVPPLESAIFRIVQEALNNIRKHSGSRRARVELFENGNTLRLIVRDWGRGFEPAKVSRERFGLQGIRQRARLLGSTAVIESTLGRGTLIAVDLPVIRREEEDETNDREPDAEHQEANCNVANQGSGNPSAGDSARVR